MTQLTPSQEPQVPSTINAEHLQAMQIVAKMKESADRYGIGFVGGFVSPDGKKFMMTNMDEDDTKALLPDELK